MRQVNRRNLLRKSVPTTGAALVLLGLLTMTSYAIFSLSTTFSNYGGIFIASRDELNISNGQTQIAGSAIAAAGTTPATAVTMTSSGPQPAASNGVPQGNWFFRVDVGAIDLVTPASQIFRVELFRWNPATLEYALIDTLYVQSDLTPATGEGARLFFNLATAPTPSEGFHVQVTRFP